LRRAGTTEADQCCRSFNEIRESQTFSANDALYARYEAEAARFPSLYLVGRLAEYRYYDMNDIVVRALAAFEELRARPLP
jgi:UDP-galactopyranose mutase